MTDVERTPGGFQFVLPGCSGRTLPKSIARSDEKGQGFLQFFAPPTAKEKLEALAAAPLVGKRASSVRLDLSKTVTCGSILCRSTSQPSISAEP